MQSNVSGHAGDTFSQFPDNSQWEKFPTVMSRRDKTHPPEVSVSAASVRCWLLTLKSTSLFFPCKDGGNIFRREAVNRGLNVLFPEL